MEKKRREGKLEKKNWENRTTLLCLTLSILLYFNRSKENGFSKDSRSV